MGEVTRSKVVRGASKAAIEAAAAKECAHQTADPDCERVLVVYGAQGANIYVESTPVHHPTPSPQGALFPRPAVSRRNG